MKALPMRSLNIDKTRWQNCPLADLEFNKPGRVELIIGADLYAKILKKGVIKIDGILGQNTDFGWIVSGGRKCEENFTKTTHFDFSGRYVVKMPFKKEQTLGESKDQAMTRFLNLEKKRIKNQNLKEQYCKFMTENMSLGHMVEANSEGKYYLPHQAVIRDASLTTKLRVVFDASAKTTNNKCLNDIMWIGPRVQKDILHIILKWRKLKKISKMCQINIAESDKEFVHVLCRDSIKNEI